MDREYLNKVLTKAQIGIAKKDIIEPMTCFYFSGKEVISYNDWVCVRYPFKTDFSTLVKAQDLLKIVSKLKTKQIKIWVKDDRFFVQSNKAKVSIATIYDDLLIEKTKTLDKSLSKVQWKKLPKDFCKNIKLCSFVASKNEIEQIFTCVYVNGKIISATDNKRIAQTKIQFKVDEMLIKASEIPGLTKINPTEYAIDKAWLFFRNTEGCLFALRKVFGKFPKVSQFFDVDGVTVKIPPSIMDGIDISTIFIDEIQPSVELTFSKNKCVLRANSDKGESEFVEKVDYKGDPIKLSINPFFLKEMLNFDTKIIFAKDKSLIQTGKFRMVVAHQERGR